MMGNDNLGSQKVGVLDVVNGCLLYTSIKVVSQKAQEIREAILKQMDRGVTMLYGEGGYLHQQGQIILSVVSNRELPREMCIRDRS